MKKKVEFGITVSYTEKALEYEGKFFWDGSSNLVIQVEFSNTEYYAGNQKNVEVAFQKLSWKATNYLASDTKNIYSSPDGQINERPVMWLKFK